MKSRLTLVTLVGFAVTVLSRAFISNTTLLYGIGLPIAKTNRLSGFLYVVLSMVVYGFIYSLLNPQYEYQLQYGIYACIMACLVVVFSQATFFISGKSYFAKTTVYVLRSFFVIALYDLLTGVLIPCTQGASFTMLLVGQIEWTLRYSLLSIIPVLFSPAIDLFIAKGLPKMQINWNFRLR